MDENTNSQSVNIQETKFCRECGQKITKKAVICPHCGCQVENVTPSQPQVVINNSNQNQNTNSIAPQGVRMCNKWVSLLLCLFLGCLGGHRFYEGKIGSGILYLFTGGFFFIGVLIDFLTIIVKPNPYAVY